MTRASWWLSGIGRREFIAVVAGVAVACPVWAQQGKAYRIGLLDYSPAETGRVRLWNAFRQRLGDLGYTDGHNLAFEPRWADGQANRLPALAKELVDLHVDVIVTAANQSVIAAQRATASIPIVMATGSEQWAMGVVAGLARPGGNVTGMTTLTFELSPKRLELFREIIPKESRFGILWHPVQGAELDVQKIQTAAQAMGIVIEAIGVQRPDELDNALSAMVQQGVVAVIVQSSPLFYTDRTRLAELAIKDRLATMTPERDYTEAGALVSYGSDFSVGFQRAADFVDKILKGAKPADLPVERPTKFELIVNLKTAKAIGLTIPESFLLRADEVIE